MIGSRSSGNLRRITLYTQSTQTGLCMWSSIGAVSITWQQHSKSRASNDVYGRDAANTQSTHVHARQAEMCMSGRLCESRADTRAMGNSERGGLDAGVAESSKAQPLALEPIARALRLAGEHTAHRNLPVFVVAAPRVPCAVATPAVQWARQNLRGAPARSSFCTAQKLAAPALAVVLKLPWVR